MIQKMSRNKAILYLATIVVVAIMICSGPLKLIRTTYTAKSDEIIARESDPVSVEYNMTQMFYGTGGELSSVDLYVCNDMAGQIITFRLYDYNHEQIYEQFYNVPQDFVAPGFINIPVRFDMEQDAEYSFIIEGLTQDLYVAYEDRSESVSPANYFMAYGGAIVEEYDLVVRYNYSCPLSLTQIVVLWGAMLLTLIAWAVCSKKLKDKEIAIKRLLQVALNPILLVLAALSGYIVVVTRLFGVDTKNNLFVTAGIWMLLGIVAYVVNVGEISIPDKMVNAIKQIKLGRLIRVIAIATSLWYCYEYMNGLYDIFHAYSTTKLFIALCFVYISTFSKKEVLNIPNVLWLVAGPVIGYLNYKPQIGVNELDELYRLYAWLIAVGGFVAINLVYSVILIVRKKISIAKVDMKFAVPFAIFAIGITVFSNGRSWTWQLATVCILLAYRLCVMEDRESFSKDLCTGIILNFYMMVWFSLRHRPFYFYQYYRYNMGYHTVTVTAYYLSLILSAAWVRLYQSFKDAKSIKSMIPKMFTFGMSATYLIFTMSRTGIFAVGCMVVFALAMSAVIYVSKDRIREVLRFVGIMVIAFVYMFPVTFFLTDIMPRISNDPITFEYEVRDWTFNKGMPYSHYNYMTIEQFCSEFSKKVFNIDISERFAEFEIKDPFAITAYAAEDNEITEEEVTEANPFEEEDVTDMSNGRIDIFKSYINVWNATGHEEMGTELPDGEIAVHAHNSFLQVAHDHGIIFGIYFVLFIGYVIILSLVRACKNKQDIYRFFCPVVIVCFCMASMVEWIMHLCNPFGLSIFLAMMPLIIKETDNEKSN